MPSAISAAQAARNHVVIRAANETFTVLAPISAPVKPVKACRIVDQNLLQKFRVVVDIAIEKLDFLGVVHHTLLAPAHMGPIGRPAGPVRGGLQIRAPERYRIIPPALEGRGAITVRD